MLISMGTTLICEIIAYIYKIINGASIEVLTFLKIVLISFRFGIKNPSYFLKINVTNYHLCLLKDSKNFIVSIFALPNQWDTNLPYKKPL